MPSRQSVYVVDTHPLWWHLTAQSRLSITAREVFRQAQAGEAVVIVPAIVVAELYYLSAKLGTPIVPAEFMGDLAENGMTLTELVGRNLNRLIDFQTSRKCTIASSPASQRRWAPLYSPATRSFPTPLASRPFGSMSP